MCVWWHLCLREGWHQTTIRAGGNETVNEWNKKDTNEIQEQRRDRRQYQKWECRSETERQLERESKDNNKKKGASRGQIKKHPSETEPGRLCGWVNANKYCPDKRVYAHSSEKYYCISVLLTKREEGRLKRWLYAIPTFTFKVICNVWIQVARQLLYSRLPRANQILIKPALINVFILTMVYCVTNPERIITQLCGSIGHFIASQLFCSLQRFSN